jgi:hypothetical protein
MNLEEILIKRKQKIKSLLNDYHNLVFVGIFIFAIIIRLYYFILTKFQPLWWDEADYMAYAKTLAGVGDTAWIVTPQHNSLFSYLAAVLFKINFSEVLIKFSIVVIPSILLIFLTYKIVSLMYEDKRIALVSSFLMAIFWNILFNSFRFHIETLALLGGFLAIYIFFQGYEKKQKIFGKINYKWAIPLTVIFTLLTYSVRRGYFLFGVFFLVYILSTKKWTKLIKEKYNWGGLLIVIIFFFIIEKIIFTSKITDVAGTYAQFENSFSWGQLKIFNIYFNSISPDFFSNIFTYLFWGGLIILIISVFLSIGYIKKINYRDLKGDLFFLLSILITLGYFIFYQRDVTLGDPRWYFPAILGSFICISRSAIFLTDQIKKYNKQIASIFLILIICYGGYYQLQHADSIIKGKINSFEGVKQSGIYLREKIDSQDIIITSSLSQTAYYAEKKTEHVFHITNRSLSSKGNFEEFLDYLEVNNSLKYLIISFSEPNNPEWMRDTREEYTYSQNEQIIRNKWKIPFMDTIINFQTGQQDIKQSKTYGNITFNLLIIKEDVFVYRIDRK